VSRRTARLCQFLQVVGAAMHAAPPDPLATTVSSAQIWRGGRQGTVSGTMGSSQERPAPGSLRAPRFRPAPERFLSFVAVGEGHPTLAWRPRDRVPGAMKVLHAFWLPEPGDTFVQAGALRLWAEVPQRQPTSRTAAILPRSFQLPRA